MKVSDLIGKLRSWPKNTNLDDQKLLAICRELIPGGIDPSNVKELIETLQKFVDQDLLADEDVESAEKNYIKNQPKEVEDLEPLIEEKGEELGSKSLNAQDLRELLIELDEHEAKIGKKEAKKENIGKQVEELLKRNAKLSIIKKEDLVDAIERRREIEEEELAKNVEPEVAEEIAEERVLIEKEIEEIAPDIDEIKIKEISESIVENKEVVKTVENVEKDKIIASEIVDLSKQVKAEREIKKQTDKLVQEVITATEAHLDDLDLKQKKLIEKLIEVKVKEAVADPFVKVTDPEVVKGVIKEDLVEKIEQVYGKQFTPSQRTQVTIELEKKAEGGIKKIQTENGSSSSAALIREKRGEMFARGVNPREIKALLTLRYSENVVAEDVKTIEVLNNNHHADGKFRESAGESNVIKQFLKSTNSVSKNIENISAVKSKLEGIKGMEPLVKVVNVLEKNPKLTRGLEMIRKMSQFRDKIDGFTGGTLSKAGNFLKIPQLEQFGMSLLNRFGGEVGGAIATHLAEFGLENGIKSILGQLLTTGTVKAVAAGAGVVAEGALTAAGTAAVATGEAAIAGAAIATGPPGWVIGLVLMAADLARKLFGSLIKNVGNKITDLLAGAGLISKENLNKLGQIAKDGGKVVLAGLGVIGTTILAVPAMLGSAFLLVGTVLVITIVALLGYNMYQTASTQLSPLVINKENTPGVCIPLEEITNPGPGSANCNINAPATNAINVTKANFVNVAERWRAGGGVNAEKCFNDVVCRAKSAGINPDYALWAWLHESGASNYKGFPSVSDFGIIYVPKNDFVAQITAFLKLDPASGCLGKNGITDYWLAFAANYLNGSDNCDPDFLNVSSNITPRQYLAEMKATWGWISSGAMPSSIHITPEKCGGGDDESNIIDGEDGDKLLCEPGSDGNIGDNPFDPNAPGLPGVIIPGECSVSNKVVLTKQCDPKWASKPLPKGGTICQAGCGPTSVSMMLRINNGSWTPDSVIYAPGSAYSDMGFGGSSLDQAYLTLVKTFGGGAVTLNGTTRSCDEKAIGAWICAGKVVMVLEDAYTKNGTGGHFLLGVAVNGGNIITADPYYNVSTPFDGKKEYGHAAKIRGCLTVDASAIK